MRPKFTQREFFSWLRKAEGEAECSAGTACLLAKFLPTVGINVFHVYRDKYEETLDKRGTRMEYPLPVWAQRVISRFDKSGSRRGLHTLSMNQSRRLFSKQMRSLA